MKFPEEIIVFKSVDPEKNRIHYKTDRNRVRNKKKYKIMNTATIMI